MAEINRSVLFAKLNPLLFSALESATAFCKLRGNAYVELAHWLHQIIQTPDNDLQLILRHYEIADQRVAQDIISALDRLPRGASAVTDFSEHIDSAVEQAWIYASLQFAASRIRSGHLLAAILETRALRRILHSICGELARISADQLSEQLAQITAHSCEQPSEPQTAAPASGDGERALAQYAQDMTARARRQEIDPVTGRDEEIRQMIDILMRRRQNNPLLTGEAGVGKTAVVEGLAQRIVSGEVPPPLRDVELWLLDTGLLQAGAGVKGEFEKRLNAIIHEVQSSPTSIILFIDEIHTLIGAGGPQGTGDAANLLKPALARGQLRTIGATTWSEYKKYIEKDPALTRRFQVIQVQEPQQEKALQMLRSIVTPLERHHRVLVLDEAIEAAVRLSHRYIPARQLPDKAIALLDTACARVAVSQHARPDCLQDCLQRIHALETEREIVLREARIGAGDPLRGAQIDDDLATLRHSLAQLTERWQQEKALTEKIIELRAALHQTAVSPPPAPEEDLCAQLATHQARLKALQGETPLVFAAVDSAVVGAVVSDWTGIPLGRMVKNDIDAVLNLADTLSQRVTGQRHALDAIARQVRTSRARLDDPHKPVGVFLLAGPSGVGKTETALALADTLYSGEQNLITINMSEFQEPHSISTLKGAPPGYVGYGEGGVLTEAVRRRPYSVVLLDEIEKAHPDVHEIFFQVFDKGWMEDGEGRHIDFRNTVIILTSNVGADLLTDLCRDPQLLPEPEALTAALRQPLRAVFPAALLGRLQVIPYYPLSDASLGNIIRLQLERIRQRLADNYAIATDWDDALVERIISRCCEVESGGRMVNAILTSTLLPRLSHELLSAAAGERRYRTLHLSVQDNEFIHQFLE
ncbi:type VI secretion system ATPase TssH [Entomohabitans teleogrylli]|uniref:type VI secretion system ATPase TssH n=1 Tax=Entomohabitans teleogrylli TaxID=1384589 RepID=UPI00073D3D3C|nr:type VI secretion system ATPase TssH [Entomohabitans teleogrylli]